MNVYKMNDYDWVCANSNEEAMDVYKNHLKETCGMKETDIDYQETMEDTEPILVDSDKLKNMKFYNEDTNETITFEKELSKHSKPEFFASTEY